MDANKLTTKSQEAFSEAVRRASASGNPQVEPVHLLLALLAQDDGVVPPLLEAVGADRITVRTGAEQLLSRLPSAMGSTVAAPQLSRQSIAVVNAAGAKAKDLGDE